MLPRSVACLQAAAALAALSHDATHQKQALKAGCVPPLVQMLSKASAAAQAYAAQALANAAAYSAAEGQNVIAAAGAVPLLLTLLGVGKAQMPAARALAKLAKNNKGIQAEITNSGGIALLLSLLNGLDVEAQVQAAAALSEMARDNVETQSAIAKAGGIGPLLALLTSRSSAAQSQGMAALAQLARHNRDNQDAIARMGGVKPLVQLRDSPSPDVAAHAASALMEISGNNTANQKAVVDSVAVYPLSNLMKNSPHPRVKAEVAGALWSLSADAEIKVDIAAAGTISPLVQLFGTGDARARELSAGALASLGLNNSKNQVQITQMLIELLISGQPEAQERAVRALRALVDENPSAHEDIAKAGNPSALVELLKNGIPEAKDYSLWSLSLSISTESQGTVLEAGGVQPLIDQLSDARVFIQEQAAAALAKLAYNNETTRAAVTQVGAEASDHAASGRGGGGVDRAPERVERASQPRQRHGRARRNCHERRHPSARVGPRGRDELDEEVCRARPRQTEYGQCDAGRHRGRRRDQTARGAPRRQVWSRGAGAGGERVVRAGRPRGQSSGHHGDGRYRLARAATRL